MHISLGDLCMACLACFLCVVDIYRRTFPQRCRPIECVLYFPTAMAPESGIYAGSAEFSAIWKSRMVNNSLIDDRTWTHTTWIPTLPTLSRYTACVRSPSGYCGYTGRRSRYPHASAQYPSRVSRASSRLQNIYGAEYGRLLRAHVGGLDIFGNFC
ncbi:hypothetical protein GGR52DRAFT_34330 [Hypoxylon sp. FL1284]|nr:hypothetical protein GGR52DRAFT_34330 [Hypoxylon sp. FL1284]